MLERHTLPSAIDPRKIELFQRAMRGDLLRPGDSGYDDARKLFNGMIDKRPALIAQCTDVADIVRCVNFARENRHATYR